MPGLLGLPCPACSADSFEYACADDAREYFLCPGCGLVFLDPDRRLVPEKERERYLLHQNDDEDSGYSCYLSAFIDSSIEPFAPPPASVLDYGSGPYPLLSRLLSGRGYRVAAFDPFFSPGLPGDGSPFDLVVAHEVIEHCFDPRAALERMAGHLHPSGILSLSTHFRPDGPRAFLSWWYRQDSTHVSFFSEPCLDLLCGRLGFERVWGDGGGRAAFRLSAS